MAETIQLWAILIAVLGVLVTLIITIFKFGRNTVTKEDLNNSIESLRLDINKRFQEVNRRFEEVDRRFEEAATDRRRIEEDAADDRQKIRGEMSSRFAEAAEDRQKIREEAAGDRQKIREEMSSGFAEAAEDRQKIREEAVGDRQEIRDEARDERKAINAEMIRQNQNYIEHLAHHNIRKASPVSEEDDST